MTHPLPQHWQEVRLKDIGKAVIGLTYSPNDVVKSGGTLVLRSSNIRNFLIDYNDQVRVGIEVSDKNILKEGDILICARNGSKELIGKNAYIEKQDAGHAFGAFMSVFRTKQSRFIKYLFQTSNFKKKIQKDLGPTINQVTTGNLHSFKFAIPPAIEQHRIVAVLETWDKAIEKLEKKIELKKILKTGFEQRLLTGKVRLPGYTGQWKTVSLGDLVERIKRKNTEGNSNILTISAQDGLVHQREFFYKQIASENLLNYTLLRKGDFAYNKSYSNGYPMGAIKRLKAYEAGIVSSLYICFKNKDNVNADFLDFYFNAGLFNQEIGQVAQEGARNHGLLNIGVNEFFGGRLLLPPAKEQVAIAEALNASEREIAALSEQLKLRHLQKNYLLNNLISGHIRTPENMPIPKP